MAQIVYINLRHKRQSEQCSGPCLWCPFVERICIALELICDGCIDSLVAGLADEDESVYQSAECEENGEDGEDCVGEEDFGETFTSWLLFR